MRKSGFASGNILALACFPFASMIDALTMPIMSASSQLNNAVQNTLAASEQAMTPLPQRLLVGYTTNHCGDLDDMTKVTQAVKDGVNVLIWSFLQFDISKDNAMVELSGGPSDNLQNFAMYKQMLKNSGYCHVVHLIAFGGWNGPHLPSGVSGSQLYKVWKKWNTQSSSHDYYFDGLDWDLEGQDDQDGPRNVITVECLEQMRDITQLAKQDGFYVSMAPAESYLDITTSSFSRYLNLTYQDWHTDDFPYHGRNVYAYLLANGGINNFDFVQIQFYESYSHAGYQIIEQKISPTNFLVQYIDQLLSHGTTIKNDCPSTKDVDSEASTGFQVNFEDDPSVNLPSQFIPIPLNKLVFGFANGWCQNNRPKTVWMSPPQIQRAFEVLATRGQSPRGCMFWVIEEEGTNEVFFAKGLEKIFHVSRSDDTEAIPR